MRLKIIVLLAAALVCAGLYVIFKSDDPQEGVTLVPSPDPGPGSVPVQQRSPVESWQPPRLTADSYESELGPLPRSLQGTRIPFDIRVDDQNHLIIEPNLRRLFDYFFTLVGEEDIAQIKSRIEELLTRYLPEPAQSEAITIFEEYVRVKEGELALREQLAADYDASGRSVDLEERVRLLRDLRQSVLSPEVYDAFYAEEDKRAVYSLDRHAILRDESLSLEERNAALRELDAQLPESLRQAKEEEYTYEELEQKIGRARETGASDAEIFQMRSEAYGPEAAERFAEADREQREWDRRVAAYRAERRAIIDSGLSEADQAAEIDRLREQHFTGPELMRIPVVDRMYDEAGKP